MHYVKMCTKKNFERKDFKHHKSVRYMRRQMIHELKSENITKKIVRANGFQRETA